MSELDFESHLGGQLRAYAQGGVRPVDRYAIAEATVAAGSTGRPAFRLGRPGWVSVRATRRVALVLAAVLVMVGLLGGALLLIAGHQPAPTPTPARTAEPTAPPVPSLPLTSKSYQGEVRIVAPMPDGVSLDAAIALPDGRVLQLAGGADDRGASIADPTTWRFKPTTGRLNARRSQPDVVLLDDGRVLVIGGDLSEPVNGESKITTSTAEVYDPATDTFEKTGPMQTSTWISAAVRMADGRVLVSGGIIPPGDPPIISLATAVIFDPRSGTFSSTGSMTTPRVGHTLVLLADGRVLATGGRSDLTVDGNPMTADIYDPRTGTWSATGPMTAIPAPRLSTKYPLFARAPAVALPDGRALVPGLYCQEVHSLRSDGMSDGFDATPTEIFDPITGTFSPGVAMPHCVSTATALPNGEVLVTGWWHSVATGDGHAQSWAGLFDPSTGLVRETAGTPAGPYIGLVLLPDGHVLFSSPDGLRLFE